MGQSVTEMEVRTDVTDRSALPSAHVHGGGDGPGPGLLPRQTGTQRFHQDTGTRDATWSPRVTSLCSAHRYSLPHHRGVGHREALLRQREVRENTFVLSHDHDK